MTRETVFVYGTLTDPARADGDAVWTYVGDPDRLGVSERVDWPPGDEFRASGGTSGVAGSWYALANDGRTTGVRRQFYPALVRRFHFRRGGMKFIYSPFPYTVARHTPCIPVFPVVLPAPGSTSFHVDQPRRSRRSAAESNPLQ
ncbi:hypothetical protein [Salinilacihabitans rarus]|uniref:hypothetical protein n=1 Tax=Salinilacihabitans rarus TaxID=2961596 RepID=UPI0020C9290F|nr:hypothetical protein [Salinilacihabitans rarus]